MLKFLMLKILVYFLPLILFSSANILQEAIDKAPAGATLKLPSGIYAGNIVIGKPLTILGQGKDVMIQGESKGTVITVNSSHVVLKNLQISASGDRMENLDAAIALHHVRHCEISHCSMTDTLYGIDMDGVEESIVSNNRITSKKHNIPLRGDALKLWYARNNLIKNNTIDSARDVTLTYADHNTIEGNTFLNNRYGLHLSMSHHNSITHNIFKYNAVGLLLMGVKDTNVSGNQILSSKGVAGIAVVADKVSNFHFQNNRIQYNAKALYIDAKGTERGTQRFISHNLISYNGEALHFHSSIQNNVITHNVIKGNLDDVVNDIRNGYRGNNTIAYNYWDRYAGFDRDGDNIGDRSYKIFIYGAQLWHYNHHLKFFYATPILSMVNFITRIAPFIQPALLLEDTKPLMSETSE